MIPNCYSRECGMATKVIINLSDQEALAASQKKFTTLVRPLREQPPRDWMKLDASTRAIAFHPNEMFFYAFWRERDRELLILFLPIPVRVYILPPEPLPRSPVNHIQNITTVSFSS